MAPEQQRPLERRPEHRAHQGRFRTLLGEQLRPAQRPVPDGEDGGGNDQDHGAGPGHRPPAARRQAAVREQQDHKDRQDHDARHVGPAGQPARQVSTGQRQPPRGEAQGKGRVLRGEVVHGQEDAAHDQQPGEQVATVTDHDQRPDQRKDQRVQDADGVVVGHQLEEVLAVEAGQRDAGEGQDGRQDAQGPGQRRRNPSPWPLLGWDGHRCALPRCRPSGGVSPHTITTPLRPGRVGRQQLEQGMATRQDPDITSRPIGGEQAANTLQPTGSSRHTTTLDAKVEGTITATPLVTRRPYLFQTAEATASEPLIRPLDQGRSAG